MTPHSPNDETTILTSTQESAWADDEIDLRQHLQILINWWREIFVLAIGAAVLAGMALIALRLLSTPLYESAATIAIARISSDVTFDERFRTQSDEAAVTQRASLDSRRASLVGLVKNGAIAQAVIAELGNQLNEEEAEPEKILEMMQAAIVPGRTANLESDLIRIVATADSPGESHCDC